MHKFLGCKIQRGNWLTHMTSGSPPFVWKSIEGVKEIVAKATCIIAGKFSVKLAYWLNRYSSPSQHQDRVRRLIWKSRIYERLKMLLWRIAIDCLPTRSKIGKFVDLSEISCPLCSCNDESALHLFSNCSMARGLWFGSKWGIRMDFLNLSSISQFMKLILCPANILNLEVEKNEVLLFEVLLCDQIWKYRNKVVFKGRSPCFVEIKSSMEKALIEHTSLRHQVAIQRREMNL